MTTTLTGHGIGPEQMRTLVNQHLAAERDKDVPGAVAVYTDDVEHDVVGFPTGPVRGKEGAARFYEYLTANVTFNDISVNKEYFGDDFYVVEHQYVGTFDGEFAGVPGNGKTVSFRMLHVFEFSGGAISRENVWLDGGTITAGLMS
jgi:steroid delta-isomerase-like uncharacterized protein